MQKKILFLACFVIPIAIGSLDCFAQQYPFVHYTPKDGLVNSRVRKAYQDSKGRMYFITFGGLSVYDGARFKNYTTQNGLNADLVNDVLEVGEDSLLIAVNTSELNVLVKGRMKKAITVNCPIVNQFLKSTDGNIYVSTDQGLYRFHLNRFEKLSVFFPEQKNPIEYLGVIAEYKDYIVFTTNDLKSNVGLFLYSKTKDKITDALLQLSVLDLQSDHTGIVWVSTLGGIQNLDTIALASGKLELRKPYNTLMSQERFIGNIHFNQQNELFVATGLKGIIHYTKEGTVIRITSSELFNSIVQNFFIDKENVLWICHDGNGIYKLSNTKLQSTDIFPGDNKSRIISAQLLTPDSLWVVMNNKQWILHTSSKNKTFKVIPSLHLFPLRYNKTNLYATDLHSLYIAALPKDDETTLRFTKCFTLPDTTKFGGLALFDPFGNMILFENLHICVVQNGKLIATYPFSAYDLVEGMHMDKTGQLWMVTRGGFMVFSLHPEDPPHYLQKEFQSVSEFETASPRCMVIDKNEIIWTGTRYHGLMAFEYKNKQLKKLHHFQTQNGLTDNFVTSLTCDRNDNIIIGTQTGIDRLVRTQNNSYQLENITKSNNIFAYISYVWTNPRNEAFAITNTGDIFQVEPVLQANLTSGPELLIEEMKVNGKPVSLNSSPTQLQYYQRNISFSIAAPTFIDERQVKYSYLLSGSGNNEWSDTSSIADINLLNLSPGNYTLRVKSFFPSTSYSPKEIEFPFQILPPWWQTVLFRLIAASLIMGLLIIGFRFYYTNKLRHQRTILEKQQAIEKERTRIATDMHDDLGAGLSRIKFLSETIGIKKLKHEPIEDDITSIRQYSHEMIDKMGEIVWALNEKNDSLSDLLAYTRSYAVEYLSQNGIHCTVETPDEFPSIFVSGEFRRNIYLSVKEALHNIVKHAEANSVFLRFNTQRGLHITIKDDGRGFDPGNLKPYSNGLANMQKRMKHLGGSFEINSSAGTTISLSAPLPS
jgi:signal transduction histidine kinase/ligand-binding sensor domain-containing protein